MTWDAPAPFYAFVAALAARCRECSGPTYAVGLCKRCYFKDYHRR